MSRFREKEAADLAASQALSKQLDYDERSKFRSMTMANASSVSGTSSSGAVTVNLVVNGSVSTEQDLVSAVRNGLLATQTNGNGLTLQAV
jgi:archaellum component FlaF (FlaF/FlaG flagellin family)